MKSIDEIINIPKLTMYLKEIDKKGYLDKVLDEIICMSQLEFNYEKEMEIK